MSKYWGGGGTKVTKSKPTYFMDDPLTNIFTCTNDDVIKVIISKFVDRCDIRCVTITISFFKKYFGFKFAQREISTFFPGKLRKIIISSFIVNYNSSSIL